VVLWSEVQLFAYGPANATALPESCQITVHISCFYLHVLFTVLYFELLSYSFCFIKVVVF